MGLSDSPHDCKHVLTEFEPVTILKRMSVHNSVIAEVSQRADALTSEAAAMLQALRRDLRALEDDARALATELEDATDWNPGQGSLQQLEGRFLCLAGMYKAHSQVSIPGPRPNIFPITARGNTNISSLASVQRPTDLESAHFVGSMHQAILHDDIH